MNAMECLLTRRSVKAKSLMAPAPEGEVLEQILTAALRVPDHGKLAPWRLLLLHEAGQRALGDACAARFTERNPDATPEQIAHERAQASRAPLLVVAIYSPVAGRIPEWEQQLSMGAVCMNLLHACHASGFAANWLTEWPAFDSTIAATLGLGEAERIAGFIYIGTRSEMPDERPRPEVNEKVSVWGGDDRIIG